MRRRNFLISTGAAVASSLARPSIAQPAKKLIFVPQANLTSLEPHGTPPTVTRNFCLQVLETLYGVDVNFKPSPQMAEGHVLEEDGRRCTIRLRDGLRFHDGEPVLARDCAASLKRWMVRDSLGQTLAARLDALETPDDRTLVFRLSKPFPDLLYVLGNPSSPAFIMPARLAATDPFKPPPELVGSGPFRFIKDEYVSGSLAVLNRFQAYVPRAEPADYTAGGRQVFLDRVEWQIIPDASTAANALVTGEVDWVEYPLPDLLAMLRRHPDIVVRQLDPNGLFPCMRLNHLASPTDNPGVRRAILATINQTEVMRAVMGADTTGYRLPTYEFLPGSPSDNKAAMDRIGGSHSPAQIKAMLDAAGYRGERLVLMHPIDQNFYNAMSQVVAAELKQAGFNVDDQSMDWGTVVQRRSNKGPLDKGGWSMFPTSYPGGDFRSPLTAFPLRGNGMAAWYGWPNDPKIEALREKWIDTADPGARTRLAEQIQEQAFTNVPGVPLGNFLPSAAWRTRITGQLTGMTPVFWNIRKA
jgi:peptide/nickel transport system substrate-binding protein